MSIQSTAFFVWKVSTSWISTQHLFPSPTFPLLRIRLILIVVIIPDHKPVRQTARRIIQRTDLDDVHNVNPQTLRRGAAPPAHAGVHRIDEDLVSIDRKMPPFPLVLPGDQPHVPLLVLPRLEVRDHVVRHIHVVVVRVLRIVRVRRVLDHFRTVEIPLYTIDFSLRSH